MDIVPNFNISVGDTPYKKQTNKQTNKKTRNIGIHMDTSHSNGQFLFQSPKKAMPENAILPHNCTHLTG